ncbi:8344_t:CDS:2 [Rhizophagus irregularis]|nr:8344_t:CDS:2 [Rhizophagus irregularis]
MVQEDNHSNYASACSSPVPNRTYTFEESSNVSDIIPSIIAKTVVSRENIDYRDIGVEITSFAHPAKANEYDQTIQYSQNDLSILRDVTHFVASVVEDDEVNYTKLRQLLENRETKSSSSNDSSNILGNSNESSNLIKNISQEGIALEKENIENKTKEIVEEVIKEAIEEKVIEEVVVVEKTVKEGKEIKQANQLDPIIQELEQTREENEKLKIHSDNLRREVDILQKENEQIKIYSDNFLKELNHLREENKNFKFDSVNWQELEKLREENKRLKMALDSQNNTNSLELESMREENERLKLELHAYKRNTRPLSKSPSKDTKESKTIETRRNIFRDKLYFKLQLTKVDELEVEALADLVKEIMLILKIDDVNRVIPSLEQINKVVRLVPQLRDFIKTVILLVLNDYEEINQEFSSNVLPQDIPPENMLKTTIEVLSQWRETVKNMEIFAAQLLQNSRTNTQNIS